MLKRKLADNMDNNQRDKIAHRANIALDSEDVELQQSEEWERRIRLSADRAADNPQVLKPLVEFLVAMLDPVKIYLLRHIDVDTGEHSDYFELMIVMTDYSSSYDNLEPILALCNLKNKFASFSLHDEEMLLRGLKNGAFFFTMYFTPARKIYEKTKSVYPVASSKQIERMIRLTIGRFDRFVENARGFYSIAVSDPGITGNGKIIFMLHKAVSLMCQAVLVCLGGIRVKAAELNGLMGHVGRFSPQLPGIFNADNNAADLVGEKENQLLLILDKGCDASSCQEDFDLDAATISLLSAKVGVFQDVAIKVVLQRLGSFGRGIL